MCATREACLCQAAVLFDEGGDFRDPLPCPDIGEDEGAVAAHFFGVAVHDVQAGADEGGEVDLVDDQQVAAGDAGAALAGDLVAGGDVDDVDGEVGEFGAEGGG